MSRPEAVSQTGRASVRSMLKVTQATVPTERGLHPSLVATYRLRTVAVGALIAASALVNFIVYMLLDGHGRMTRDGFLFVMALGIVALALVVLTPWNKVLVGKWAIRMLYGCSLYAIALVGVAIYLDGGGSSVLYVMVPSLMVFFAIAYPKRAQLVLFVVTVAVYLSVVGLRGWNVTAATLYIRVANLAITGYAASALSGWLVMEMRDRVKSSSTADQRAGMLETVARAARRISSLDASTVQAGALSGALELGCYESEIWMIVGEPAALTLQRRVGLDVNASNDVLARQLFDRARVSGRPEAIDSGRQRTIGALLHSEGMPNGLLLVKTMQSDAADALVVECIELLAAQVSAGLDVAKNVAERRGLEERLAHWAFHDSLTDLPNRVLFADRLELALARATRDHSNVAVLFLDLDNFKEINDGWGHAAGDELLKALAVRLHACLRPNDTLARYGGDEFIALVEQIDESGTAVAVAARMLEALVEPVPVGDREVVVRTSIGIAMTAARPGADSDVLRRADIAMYQAKAAGGSRYVLSPSAETGLRAADPPADGKAAG